MGFSCILFPLLVTFFTVLFTNQNIEITKDLMKPFRMISIGSNISSVLDGFAVFPFLSACLKLHASYLFDSDPLQQLFRGNQ